MTYTMPAAVKAELIRLEARALAITTVYALGALWAHQWAPGTIGFAPVPE